MSTYVISDLHIGHSDPLQIKALEIFYKHLILNDHLIILGDLFDFFVGLDPKDKVQLQVRSIIGHAAKRGIKTFFMPGNRDFLITKKAAEFFHMHLLPNFHVISTNKGPALLLHGDQLCLNDRSFQRFRTFTNNRFFRFIFLHLPMSCRRHIGERMREKSRRMALERLNEPQTYDLVKEAATEFLRRSHTKIMIHGHFHKFGAHKDEFGEGTYRFSLGCWARNYSYFHSSLTRFELVQKPMERLF